MDIMEKPERSNLDLFGPENLAAQKAVGESLSQGRQTGTNRGPGGDISRPALQEGQRLGYLNE